ncbi:phosphatase 2C-like domain-containing protein [Crucibulum laeve]|uniref:protein-serine/threonine phosphatase n=1 Tax=Crucibulum laeve TaxID=68775 RepID=A0A5C3LTG7_9AGAR|nr:phosphatase 2C-like domain-containing protein [Crucibulum laeve]
MPEIGGLVGCTAIVALITSDNEIYIANAGDCRSVIGIKGEAKALSIDHKPNNSEERARVFKAGGYIYEDYVNDKLSLTRALGDFDLKQNKALTRTSQIITAYPDVETHEITEDDEFLVLAGDGIWDSLSSQGVVNFIRHQVAQREELTTICEALCDICVAPSYCDLRIGSDNMTIIIVALTHGRTKEEWYAWIKGRVENKYGYDTPRNAPRPSIQYRW